MKIRALLGVLALLLCAAVAQAANKAANQPAAPGGEGTITSNMLINGCFKSKSDTVAEVCGNFTIRWKLWTLMGEPVGNYVLSWKLESIKLVNPANKASFYYAASNLPSMLSTPAKAIELYVDAVSSVDNSSSTHRFNTGVPVRAGAGNSYNMPGSPNWAQLFMLRGGCEAEPSYLDAASAKALFIKGVQLSGQLQFCPASGASGLDAVENAVAKLCAKPGADKEFSFCPPQKIAEKKPAAAAAAASSPAIEDRFASLEKKMPKAQEVPSPGKDPFAALGQGGSSGNRAPDQDMGSAFANAEAERAAAIERKRKFDAAYASCKEDMQAQERCAKDSCGREPPAQVCTRSEERRQSCNARPGESCLIIPQFDCVAYGPNAEHAKWDACVRESTSRCAAQGAKITSLAACTSERLR